MGGGDGVGIGRMREREIDRERGREREREREQLREDHFLTRRPFQLLLSVIAVLGREAKAIKSQGYSRIEQRTHKCC